MPSQDNQHFGKARATVGGGLIYRTAGAGWATSSRLASDRGYLIGLGYDLPLGNGIKVGGEVLLHQFENNNGSGLAVGVTTFKARVAFNF